MNINNHEYKIESVFIYRNFQVLEMLGYAYATLRESCVNAQPSLNLYKPIMVRWYDANICRLIKFDKFKTLKRREISRLYILDFALQKILKRAVLGMMQYASVKAVNQRLT